MSQINEGFAVGKNRGQDRSVYKRTIRRHIIMAIEIKSVYPVFIYLAQAFVHINTNIHIHEALQNKASLCQKQMLGM